MAIFTRKKPDPLLDYDFFSEAFLKIKHKTSSEIVALQPTHAQQMFRRLHRRKSIILKARQEGISTDVLGRFFWKTVTRRNVTTVIVSHEADATDKLLRKVKFYYDNLPNDFKPELDYDSKHEMRWPGLNSTFYVGTAGGRGVGRGDTIDNFHCSELAQWECPGSTPKATFLALLAAVPPQGEVVIESTAQGIGNYFWEKWRDAESGKSEFQPIFIPWMMDPAYALPCKDMQELLDFFPVDKETEEYEDRFKLTLQQRRWHRQARRDFGDLFDQEYPASPELAFVSTQRCYFPGRSIAQYRKQVEHPYRTVSLTRSGNDITLKDDRHGFVDIWRIPRNDRPYVVFADVAEGLEHGDYSAAYVYDAWDKDYVASWHGHLDPDLFADELDMLGKLYKGTGSAALLGVERNNHGMTTLIRLKRDLRYPRLYYRRVLDKRTRQETESLGWETNLSTKRWMNDLFAAGVRDGTVGIWDVDLLEECQTFLKDERGIGAAPPPRHDDRVMAASGCMAIAAELPPRPAPLDAPVMIPVLKPGDGMRMVEAEWRRGADQEKRKVASIDNAWRLF